MSAENADTQIAAGQNIAKPSGDTDVTPSQGKVEIDPGYEYIYDCVRGKKAIVFSNSREETEYITATLRQIADNRGEPDTFLIHHGNLSASIREEAESRMQDDEAKYTVGATVTMAVSYTHLDVYKRQYSTKTEARNATGILLGGIIDDDNWYEYIKLLAVFFRKIGYRGFVVFIDECVNLYKITNRVSRENNYEKLLAMFNDTLQGKAEGLALIFGGTPQFLEDTRRGLSVSYTHLDVYKRQG